MENYSKFIKQSPDASNSAPKKTNDVEIHLGKIREMRKTALKVSEFLTGQLQPETFLRCLKHITQKIYDGVVEERALNKTCGYPLCSKVLSKQLRQLYCIDPQERKLYDGRKLQQFCSKICYKASAHIKNQINIDFLSANSGSKQFNLLSTDEKASQVSKISEPEQFKGTILNSREPQTNSAPKEEIEKVKVVPDSKDFVSKIKAVGGAKIVKENIEPTPPVKKSLFSQKRANGIGNNAKSNIRFQPSIQKKVDSLKIIKDSFLGWVTIDTYKFLYGEDKVVDLINKERLAQQFKSLNLEKVSDDVKTKYKKVVHKLKLLELPDEKFDKRAIDPCLLKPLPNYKQLQHETENSKLKLLAWNEGQMYDKSLDEKFPVPDDRNHESNSVVQIKRRKIYMKSISPAVKKLAKSLFLHTHDVQDKLQLLLETFNLSAHNIMFEPLVGTVISLILIQLLGIYDEELRTKLENVESMACIKATYELIPGATTQILDELKDINIFLTNFLSSSEDTQQTNKPV